MDVIKWWKFDCIAAEREKYQPHCWPHFYVGRPYEDRAFLFGFLLLELPGKHITLIVNCLQISKQHVNTQTHTNKQHVCIRCNTPLHFDRWVYHLAYISFCLYINTHFCSQPPPDLGYANETFSNGLSSHCLAFNGWRSFLSLDSHSIIIKTGTTVYEYETVIKKKGGKILIFPSARDYLPTAIVEPLS